MFKVSALVMGFAFCSSAFAVDKAYYEIKSMEVKEVTQQYAPYMDLFAQPGLADNCNTVERKNTVFGEGSLSGIGPLDTVEIAVDQIINIGKKIWTIVDAGKPVVNLRFDTANALPKGVTCWTDLSGWSMPQSKVYRVTYKNGFGSSVVDFSYRVAFTAKGNIDGVGQYITNATFLPANVNVSWGFKLDAEAAVPSVFNQGTKANPLAGMQMDMKWTVTSPVVTSIQSQSYFVSGDNNLVQMQ